MKRIILAFLLIGYEVGLGAGAAREERAASTQPAALQRGYRRVIEDLENHWWDATSKIPRIRPTRGGNSSATANDVGIINNNAGKPSVWQMAQFANVQFWNWRLTGSAKMKAHIRSEWKYVRSVYSDGQISSSARSDGIVNVSDDAAWEMTYLVQVHEVVGDEHALGDARALLPNVLNRFADPYVARVSYGGLQGSPYGILYATKTDDASHQDRSSTYEIGIANDALYLYQRDHNPDYLSYAIGTFNSAHKYARHVNPTFYYCELDLKPRNPDGSANPHYLKTWGGGRARPERGRSAAYSGGTMAMGVLAARLFKITGKQDYLDEARLIAGDFVRRDCFLRPGNLLLNDRDGWTDGYWAPYFAAEVIPLPGVDDKGLWKTAIACTAASIISQRTADGFYGADWSGPENGTWLDDGARDGMALPNQMMTSADSASMVTAAEVVGEGSRQ